MKAMKQTHWHKLAILALSVAIAGCAMPSPFGGIGAPARVDAARPAATAGTVEVHLHWPDKRAGYGTQAIPNRAVYAVVTLTDATGSVLQTARLERPTMGSGEGGTASPAPVYSPMPSPSPDSTPVPDLSPAPEPKPESTVAPEPTPSPSGMTVQMLEGRSEAMPPMGSAFWSLPQQERVTIRAELFDKENRSVGVAERVVDVIAGYHSVVALDIQVEGAPQLTTVNPTAFKIGDRIVLEGQNFGVSQTDWSPARVYLESEGTYAWGSAFGPDSYQYRNMVYLPASSVTVASDSQIVVTIPSTMENGWHFVDALWNYFHSSGDQQLYLGVTVDGVNSNRVPVSIPRGTSAAVSVTVEQGGEAPTREAATASVDLTAAPYAIPTASGSKWVFEVTETYGDYGGRSTHPATVQLVSEEGEALISNGDQGYPNSGWRTNLRWDGQWGLLRQLAAPAALRIQVLPDETVSIPDGTSANAKHLFYSMQGGPDATSVRDVWIVPGIGPVRIREVSLHANQDPANEGKGMARQTREYRLVAFESPTGTSSVRQ